MSIQPESLKPLQNVWTLTFDNSDLVTKSGISITAVSTSIEESSTPLVYSCTGYATKLVNIFTLTVAATSASNVTDTVRATVTGIDENGNEHEVLLTFYVDTVLPVLTYVTGHQAQSADPALHWVDFGFNRDVDPDYADFAATLTVLNSASQTVTVKT